MRGKAPGGQRNAAVEEKKEEDLPRQSAEETLTPEPDFPQEPQQNPTEAAEAIPTNTGHPPEERGEIFSDTSEEVSSLRLALVEAETAKCKAELALRDKEIKFATLMEEMSTIKETQSIMESHLQQSTDESLRFKTELSTLQNQLQEKENEKATIVQSLSAERSGVTEKMREAGKRLQELEETLEKKHSEMNAVEKRCSELKDVVETVSASLTTSQTELTDCKEKRNKAEEEMRSVKAALYESEQLRTTEAESLQTTLRELESAKKSLQETISIDQLNTQIQQLIQEHTEQLDEGRQNQEAAEKELQKQREAYRELQKERDNLRSELEKKVAALETSETTSAVTIEELTRTLSTLESEHSSQVEKLAEAIKQKEKSAETLRQQCEKLGESCDVFERDLQRERSKNARIHNEVEQVRESLREKDAELLKGTHVVEALQNVQHELDGVKSEVEVAKEKLTKAIRKGKRIEEDKNALETQFKKKEEETESLKKDAILALQSEIQEKDQELEEKSKQETELRDRVSGLEKTGEEERQSSERLRNDLATAREETERLAALLGDKEAELQNSVRQCEEITQQEGTSKQRLQSAVRKGMRIEAERKQLEEQVFMMVQKSKELVNKVPEMSILSKQAEALFIQLSESEVQLFNALECVKTSQNDLLQLKTENQNLTQKHSDLDIAFRRLENLSDTKENRIRQLEAELKTEVERAKTSTVEKGESEKRVRDMSEIVKGKDSKLVRAREAIETLRKERSTLNASLADLTAEVTTLRTENTNLQEQQEAADAQQEATEIHAAEIERQKFRELERLKDLAEKKLTEVESSKHTVEKENQELTNQITALQEEIDQQTDPPIHGADTQNVEAVYKTAASLAQVLELPFMEVANSAADPYNTQLQSVQILLDGVRVGVQKNQDKLAQLPAALSELEQFKETITRLEAEVMKTRAEAVTPGSSSAVDLSTPKGGTYTQTSRVKRRELQDANEPHVIDVGEISTEDGPEVKQSEYTPLVSVHPFRTAPPPVLHFMQTVDRQTQNAGRLLGHRPIIRAGALTYALVIHLFLLVLII